MQNGPCVWTLAVLLLPAQAPALASPTQEWSRTVAEGIAQRAQAFRPVPGEAGAWAASSQVDGVTWRVSRAGLEVRSRGPEAEAWTLRLATSSFGREDASLPVAIGGVEVSGARATLALGALEEGLENGPHGLEQGWTIPAPPPGEGALWIGLELAGDLRLRIDEKGRSGTLVDARGTPRLRYRDLAVFDATGRALPARLAPGPGIRIDDAGAVYPVTVDPLLTAPDWTVEGDQVGAHLGIAVAPAGDVNGDGFSDVLVGASGFSGGEAAEGAAFLYLGSASGLALTPAWSAEPDQIGAHFGQALGPAGDVNGDGYGDVIVSAPDHPGGGRAFVYLGSAAGLETTPVWTADGSWQSVCTAGDVNGDGYSDLVLGKPLFGSSPPQNQEGQVVVVLGSAAGPELAPAWTVESDQSGAQLGTSVAPAGDVNGDGYDDVIVGAPFFDQGLADEGQARVYLGSAGGLALAPAWALVGGAADAYFGSAVASAGDVNGDGYGDVVVGAPGFTDDEAGEGRAFLYLGSGAGLALVPAWTADGNQPNAGFGSAVAGVGDVDGNGRGDVAVGLPGMDVMVQDEGSVRLYSGTATGLTSAPIRTANGTAPFATLGASVAAAGDVNGDGYGDWIAGAPDLENGEVGEGGAFVFQGAGAGPKPAATSHVESNAAGAELGAAVAVAGDVNGDGFDDVFVGAPGFDGAVDAQGLATLIRGTADGLGTAGTWIRAGPGFTGANYGYSVSGAGDVNGDGYDDVLVAYNAAASYRTDLFLGSANGLGTNPAWTVALGFFTGIALTALGDVNGDGFGDVALRREGLFTELPAVFVFLGSPTGLATVPDVTYLFNVTVDSLAGADVNGDGFSDLVIGKAPTVSVYHGSADGLGTTPTITLQAVQPSSSFGQRVANAGDVDGDGDDEILVGASSYDVTPSGNEGAVHVYLGSPAGLASTPDSSLFGQQVQAQLGKLVAGPGDLNGDGTSDVVAAGQLVVSAYFGSASGLSTTPGWSAEGIPSPTAVSGGDLNGDGFADVVIGCGPTYSNGQPGEGAVFAFLGNEGAGGRLRRLQQRTRNGNRPIAHLGATPPHGQFQARTEFLGSPAGLGWITPQPALAFLEWEVKPYGQPFDGSGVERSAVGLVLGVPSATVVLEELATTRFDPPKRFDVDGELVHWRARVVTTNPLQPTTAWFSPSGRSPTAGMLRRLGGRLR